MSLVSFPACPLLHDGSVFYSLVSSNSCLQWADVNEFRHDNGVRKVFPNTLGALRLATVSCPLLRCVLSSRGSLKNELHVTWLTCSS